jgi:hypothetical protein
VDAPGTVKMAKATQGKQSNCSKNATLTTLAEAMDFEFELRVKRSSGEEIDSSAFRVAILQCFAAFDREAPSMSWPSVCDAHYKLHELQDRHSDCIMSAEIGRAFWNSVTVVMGLYHTDRRKSGLADEKHRTHGGHLPLHLIAILENVAGNLAVGRMPSGLIERRRTPMAPPLIEAIGIAVAYRQACRPEGYVTPHGKIKISNSKPNRTLMGWFGVGKRTVQGWTSSIAPHNPFVQRANGDLLAEATKKAGQYFKESGTGQGAVLRRARQRASKG